MNPIPSKAITTGLFFLLIFLSGFWLSRAGRPYNTLIFTIHKLIGLAAGTFLIMTVSQAQKAAPLTSIQITASVATVIIFICIVAAGGLLSIEAAGNMGKISQPLRAASSTVHKTFPYLAVLSTAASLYLLFRKG